MSYSTVESVKSNLVQVTGIDDERRSFKYKVVTYFDGAKEIKNSHHRCPMESQFDVGLLNIGSFYQLTSIRMGPIWHLLSAIEAQTGNLIFDLKLSQHIVDTSDLKTHTFDTSHVKFGEDSDNSKKPDFVFTSSRVS